MKDANHNPLLIDSRPHQTEKEKLDLAQVAFHKFYGMCFWFMRKDLIITASNLPLIIKGLRDNGNRETYRWAAKLCR